MNAKLILKFIYIMNCIIVLHFRHYENGEPSHKVIRLDEFYGEGSIETWIVKVVP